MRDARAQRAAPGRAAKFYANVLASVSRKKNHFQKFWTMQFLHQEPNFDRRKCHCKLIHGDMAQA